jgi:hypothetical protein
MEAKSELDDSEPKRDAGIERWLHESVIPVFDRMMSGEEALLDATEVFSGLETRYQMRVARGLG